MAGGVVAAMQLVVGLEVMVRQCAVDMVIAFRDSATAAPISLAISVSNLHARKIATEMATATTQCAIVALRSWVLPANRSHATIFRAATEMAFVTKARALATTGGQENHATSTFASTDT